MKKFIVIVLFIIINFFNTILFANNWTKVTRAKNGHTFYIDMKKIYEIDSFIYFWQLIDYKKKDEYGDSSAKIYIKGNCDQLKFKWLKVAYHKNSMAKDYATLSNPLGIVSEWQYPEKGTTSYSVLYYVCKNKGILL